MILIIAHKELKILLGSPVAWMVLALVQVVLTWTFLAHLEAFLEIQPQLLKIANPPGITEAIVAPVFATASVILLMITPLFAARLIADERRNHTLTFLLSAPISAGEIVLGKFLSLLILVSVVVALATALSISLLAGGALDLGLLLSNIPASFSFPPVSLRSACIFPRLAHTRQSRRLPPWARCWGYGSWIWLRKMSRHSVRHISPLSHYQAFNSGIIDTFDLAYFMLFVLVFLVLAARRLDGEQLRD